MGTLRLNPGQCAGKLRALGDETRLRILASLFHHEKCVTDLVKELGRDQPFISHHLRILRDAGLVEGLREGKRVCYRVSPTVHGMLDKSQVDCLEFGCCQITFPRTT